MSSDGLNRYGALLCLCLCGWMNGHCNIIDTLSTKHSVREFLATSLGERGFHYLPAWDNILPPEPMRIYFEQPRYRMIEDPVSKELVEVSYPRDSTDNCVYQSLTPTIYPFDLVITAMDKHPYHFQKTDIDGNGLTDLVVDAGVVIAILDKGGEYMGYMFANHPEYDGLRFKNFITLPDASTALTFRLRCFVSSEENGDSNYEDRIDTVVYKYGAFVKYNPKFKPIGIRRLKYHYKRSTGMGCDHHSCFEINYDGHCHFQLSLLDTSFSAVLDSIKLTDLWNLIAYVDVKSKKDFYYFPVNHGSGNTITIYFEDGTSKQIGFWYCSGSASLMYLRQRICEIGRALQWQISEYTDLDCTWNGYDSDIPAECDCQW